MAVSIPEDLVAEWKLLRPKLFIDEPDPTVELIQRFQAQDRSRGEPARALPLHLWEAPLHERIAMEERWG